MAGAEKCPTSEPISFFGFEVPRKIEKVDGQKYYTMRDGTVFGVVDLNSIPAWRPAEIEKVYGVPMRDGLEQPSREGTHRSSRG